MKYRLTVTRSGPAFERLFSIVFQNFSWTGHSPGRLFYGLKSQWRSQDRGSHILGEIIAERENLL